MVFNAYSAFVNNFSIAMETAKKQARSKPAFADFLKVPVCQRRVSASYVCQHYMCVNDICSHLFVYSVSSLMNSTFIHTS